MPLTRNISISGHAWRHYGRNLLGIVISCITWRTIAGIASGGVCMKDDRREQIPVDELPMRRASTLANRIRVDFVRAGIFLKKSG